jgi:transposase InsO family protein
MRELDPVALFRLSVLGPLVARQNLSRGELKVMTAGLAQKDYDIPGSRRRTVAEKTIQQWYYDYKRAGLEGLAPKRRSDRGASKLSAAAQEFLLAAKEENPRRSIRMLRVMLEHKGLVARGSVSRSAIHRFLKTRGLSRPPGAPTELHERRSFVAEHAGDIWYGDVLHGPRVMVEGRKRKSYLVSLFDDASRLLTHSAFCLSEDALEIEGVLKQAVLKRGRCLKLIVDNGAAYRAGSLQGICARLDVRLIFCRPRDPQSKGKLERWHRTLRAQFLSEVALSDTPLELHELNARLWAYLEGIYHVTPHDGLEGGQTPLERYQKDLAHIRPLGPLGAQLDTIFQHRVDRLVRKDGTISYEGRFFEVPYELVGKTVQVTVDPHSKTAVTVEDESGNTLGRVTPLDRYANRDRRRNRPAVATEASAARAVPRETPTLLELACERHYRKISCEEPHEQAPDEFTAKEI